MQHGGGVSPLLQPLPQCFHQRIPFPLIKYAAASAKILHSSVNRSVGYASTVEEKSQLSQDELFSEDELNVQEMAETELKMQLEYEGLDLGPSFLSIDIDGRVIRLDTFSSILAPGFRIGWVTATAPVVQAFNALAACTSQNGCSISMMMLGRTLQAWEEEKQFNESGQEDDGSLGGVESAITTQSATQPQRQTPGISPISPLMAFQRPSRSILEIKPLTSKQTRGSQRSLVDANTIPMGGFERQLLTVQEKLRINCLDLTVAIEKHLGWAVDFQIPSSGIFLWIKLKNERVKYASEIPDITSGQLSQLKNRGGFRLRDFPRDEMKWAKAISQHGVVVLPGFMCAPQRGINSPSTFDDHGTESSRKGGMHMYRCVRLSFIADSSLYEPAMSRLKQLILDFCVPKLNGNDNQHETYQSSRPFVASIQ